MSEFVSVDGSFYRRSCVNGVGKVHISKGRANPYEKNGLPKADTWYFKILMNPPSKDDGFLFIFFDSEGDALKVREKLLFDMGIKNEQ